VLALFRKVYDEPTDSPGEAQIIMLKKRFPGGLATNHAKRLKWTGSQYADPGYADGWELAA
jgi:hypothetical protein